MDLPLLELGIPWKTIVRSDAAESTTHQHSRRVVPAVCYDECDSAYKLALSYGKKDTLCAKDSGFRTLYDSCNECLDKETTDDTQREYVEPQFEQFIDFCKNATEEEPSITATITGAENSKTTVTASRTTICAGCSNRSKKCFSRENDNNHTNAHVHRHIRGQRIDDSGPKIATIVGPVVPSVVVLILAAALGFLWYRRRQKKRPPTEEARNDDKPKEEKPQLHSDCISRPTFELEGSMPEGPRPAADAATEAEMAANEVAAHEMSTDQKRLHVIPRKEVPSEEI
ncbi:hypothetical protein FSARC_13709 [Fusarium sarcochroum]|uniref:Uncharacterized protein n=1 Tax=Fusarium sarcochroum TaxID=1208366 RepID=A0A8H4SZR7_9HYPO|nr:hypothetical protein FSARC_13709 [Fusarium sarcochroum]